MTTETANTWNSAMADPLSEQVGQELAGQRISSATVQPCNIRGYTIGRQMGLDAPGWGCSGTMPRQREL